MISNSEINQERLFILQQLLCLKLDDLFEKLDIGIACSDSGANGPCPIHGGDNPRAFTIYRTGNVNPGFWHCYTHQCEKVFQPTIIGFVRGMLSQKAGWIERGDRMVSFPETLKWCAEFVGQDLSSIKIDPKEIEKRRFASDISKLTIKPVGGAGMSRKDIRGRLKIPAKYFIDRGFSKEVLDRYDVGLCINPKLPFYNRIVVPIYDDKHKFSVGFVARSIFDICNKCNLYHNPNCICPTQEVERCRCTKWLNSKGFNRESYLYNYWHAKQAIEDGGAACLVEGQGDVWKLEEAGINCALGMFGTALTDRQQILLETSGAMKIVILTDNDDAGNLAAAEITKKLERSFKIIRPKFDAHDIGDMSKSDVQLLLRGVI